MARLIYFKSGIAKKLWGKFARFSRETLRHRTSGRGKGRWRNKHTFWASKVKARKLRRISEVSRRYNRVCGQ